MRERNERFAAVFPVLIVFVCLLLSGGSRLIGSSQEKDPLCSRPISAVQAALCAGAETVHETLGANQLRLIEKRRTESVAAACIKLDTPVLCDHNGNVLTGDTYLHTVYQAFSLGDGFA